MAFIFDELLQQEEVGAMSKQFKKVQKEKNNNKKLIAGQLNSKAEANYTARPFHSGSICGARGDTKPKAL